MATIKLRSFRSTDDLIMATAELLVNQLEREFGKPHAIMLSGGNTPIPVYREVQARDVHVADDCFVCFSDERLVPSESAESNYGGVRPMLEAVGLPEERVIRVHTGAGLKTAASRYDRELQQYVKSGGRLTLGLLGLGADGHTASLFPGDEMTRGKGAYAVAVPRNEKPDRISVTPDLLKRFEVLIFLVVGSGKRDIIRQLLEAPMNVTAGQAVQGAPSVQLWTA